MPTIQQKYFFIQFTEKGHIFVTVNLVEEVRSSLEVKTSESSSTLSGFPVADKRRSWETFKLFSQDSLTVKQASSSSSSSSSDEITLIISVEDTGVGIPQEAQSRVFTPFMQGGPSISRIHGGTGIGLSISKRLVVNLMNGEIGFVSVPQIGSTFTFSLVLKKAHNNSSDYKSSEFQGMNALVLDERPARAKVTKYHLQRLGIHCEVATELSRIYPSIAHGKSNVNMVLVEKEAWLKFTDFWPLFMSKLRKSSLPEVPKLFILANPTNSAKSSSVNLMGCDATIIMKPLRASNLAVTLQRAMGNGFGDGLQNGMLPRVPVCNLLHGRQILIVDDNAVNLKVAEGALKKYGAEVKCAESGKKAIELLFKPDNKFDACFMDIQMPEMDGYILHLLSSV